MSTQSSSVETSAAVAPARGIILARLLDRFGILTALLVMVIALTLLSPFFLTVDNLTNVARQTSVNALLALGVFVTIITAGIDLSVGSVQALSMVLLAIAVNRGFGPIPPVPGWAALLIALGVGLGFGLLNGLGLTRLRLPHPFIVTLGTLNIARGLTNLVTGGVPVSGLPPEVRWFGSADIRLFQLGDDVVVLPAPLIVVLVCYTLFALFLYRTRTGRHIYAVGGNPSAARYAGINVDRVLVITYMLSGLMAGVAGIVLAGRTNSGYPNAGIGAELDAIAAVIIGGASFFGGRGTVLGTLVGALIIGLMRNGLNLLNVSVFWQQVLIGVVIIAAVSLDVLRQRAAQSA